MSFDDENVDAGSNNSGDQGDQDSSQEHQGDQGAGEAVEQKAGDACTCPDGRPGTLHANDAGDGFVCIPNEQQG